MANVNIPTGGLPDKFMAAFNPIVVELQSDVLGSGSKAAGSITVFGANAGDTITFDGVVFTASDTPGYDEFFTFAVASVTEIAESIAQAINENLNLNYKYIADNSGGVVTINAKKTGTEFNNSIVSSTASLVTIGMVGGTDKWRAQQEPNYGIYVEIFMQPDGALMPGNFSGTVTTTAAENIATLSQKFDGDNTFKFDISNILNAYISEDTPQLGEVTITKMDKGVNNYFLKYGEEYSVTGNNFVRKYEIGNSTPLWFANAAIPFENNSNMSGYTNSGADLLSNQPATKLVYSDQNDLINMFYYNSVSTEKLAILITYTFEDGSTQTQYYFPTNALNDNYVYADVGPANLNISFIESTYGGTVKSYTAKFINWTGTFNATGITGTESAISDTQTYEISEECQDFQNKFFFLNRLGGWDSYHFIGNNSRIIEVERNQYSTFKDNEFNSPINNMQTLSNVAAETVTSSSGLITKVYADWLKELITSPRVYVYDGSMREVIITDHSWGYDEKTKLYNVEINWRYTTDINVQYNGK